MSLSVADKLALAMTSAGSQRKLAALIGISHQRVGRWIKGAQVRETVDPKTGEITERVSNVPQDSEILAAINQAFAMHRDVSRQQARIDNLPFDPAYPVFTKRLEVTQDYTPLGLKTGDKGYRAIVEHTDTMSPDLRDTVLGRQISSREYTSTSVRSLVDLVTYFKKTERELRGTLRTEKQERYRKAMRKRIEKLQSGEIFAPIWTRQVDSSSPRVKPERSVSDIRHYLTGKHEPAAQSPNAKIADEFLFTTARGINDRKQTAKAKPKAQAKPQARKSRQTIRGRGPK